MGNGEALSNEAEIRAKSYRSGRDEGGGRSVPAKTIHQVSKSGLVWAPSIRAVAACETSEDLRRLLEIKENGRDKEVRRNLEAKLKEAGKL